MNTLVVRHVADSDPPAFVVVRARDAQTTEPLPVAPPAVELLADVRWYLEQFLEYPFSPNIERAERILAALRDWGTRAFTALLGEGKGRDYFNEATQGGLERAASRTSRSY